MMRYLLPLITLFLAVPSWGAAQDPVQLFEGDRVRVTAPDCGLHQRAGTFGTIQGGALSLNTDGGEIRCPLESLTRLEVSLGEREWHKDGIRGMRYGLLGGLAAGAVVIATAGQGEGFPILDAGLVTAGGGALGFLVGSIVGSTRDPEDWLDVPLYAPLPYAALSLSGRVQLGFSIPFGR